MEENGKHELEVVGSPLESDKLIEISERAEKRIGAVLKIKSMALRLTNFHDWTDMGGKPYLQVSGAEKIARLFGISWRFTGDIARKDEEGGHFSFEVPMEFIMSGISVEFRGSRSSKDPFFSKKRGEAIPPSEIDRTDVMKAAITNTIGNGITRLLGIRNLTWDDLKDAKVEIDKIGRVDYRKASGAASSQAPPQEQNGHSTNGKPEIKDPASPATDKQIEAIKNIGKGLGLSFDQILSRGSKAVGRPVESLEGLKKGEAGKFIELLQKEREEAKK